MTEPEFTLDDEIFNDVDSGGEITINVDEDLKNADWPKRTDDTARVTPDEE